LKRAKNLNTLLYWCVASLLCSIGLAMFGHHFLLIAAGIWIWATGIGCNWIARYYNNNFMPTILKNENFLQYFPGLRNQNNARLKPLCDRFHFSSNDGEHIRLRSYSIGDILMWVGIVTAIIGVLLRIF
jgi:hypothetical protein